ncbi:hypothetical protein QBC35DRAFT_475431 [Podospora australis]|uniref:Uncharacterized protein n=1 Tax=Podospora australis TaxID=1536484 RepID=A0AAN6WS38_9PEZI|nr:hypothetical protein QBC35DRAFT_475431 [Podospora australis]
MSDNPAVMQCKATLKQSCRKHPALLRLAEEPRRPSRPSYRLSTSKGLDDGAVAFDESSTETLLSYHIHDVFDHKASDGICRLMATCCSTSRISILARPSCTSYQIKKPSTHLYHARSSYPDESFVGLRWLDFTMPAKGAFDYPRISHAFEAHDGNIAEDVDDLYLAWFHGMFSVRLREPSYLNDVLQIARIFEALEGIIPVQAQLEFATTAFADTINDSGNARNDSAEF